MEFGEMLFTIDRINAVRKAAGLPSTSEYATVSLIEELDQVYGISSKCPACAHKRITGAPAYKKAATHDYLGKRLSRLELWSKTHAPKAARRSVPYFWLGEQAENI